MCYPLSKRHRRRQNRLIYFDCCRHASGLGRLKSSSNRHTYIFSSTSTILFFYGIEIGDMKSLPHNTCVFHLFGLIHIALNGLNSYLCIYYYRHVLVNPWWDMSSHNYRYTYIPMSLPKYNPQPVDIRMYQSQLLIAKHVPVPLFHLPMALLLDYDKWPSSHYMGLSHLYSYSK